MSQYEKTELEIIQNWQGLKPVVSITCCTYNQITEIRRAMEGFLLQKTNFPFEIIVGDDASTDGTSEILFKYKEKYPNVIKIIQNKTNIGAGKNWQNILHVAVGKYIANCEGDDYWIDDQKLQKQYDFMESNQGVGLIWTNIMVLDQTTQSLMPAGFIEKKSTISISTVLVRKPFFSTPTWFYRSKFIKYVDGIVDKGYCDGTFPLLMDIMSESKIHYVDEVTAVYQKNIESTSNSRSLRKRIEFAKGIYKIQTDYYLKYKFKDIGLKYKIDNSYYETALPYSIVLDDDNEKSTAINFINSGVASTKLKIIYTVLKIPFGKSIIKYVYTNKKIKDILSRFKK